MNDFNRTIFTEKRNKADKFVDVCFAIVIGLSLCMLVLHGLDALTY